MNQVARPLPHMTTDDFLALPHDPLGRRWQLVDGEVKTVSPASRTPGVIQANLAHLLLNAVIAANLDLQVQTDAAVVPLLAASTNVRVPDLVVAPSTDERGEQVVPDPVLLIEVLSPGNTGNTRDNVRAYATLPSVAEIVVVHSTRILAEVSRRGPDGAWLAEPEHVEAGGRLRLASVGLDCPLDALYRTTWLARRVL